MITKWKQRCLCAVMVLVAAMGCNPLWDPMYLMREDTKTPPEYPLTVPPERLKAKEDARVMILVSAVPGLDPEFIGIDRKIALELVKSLEECVKANKEKVSIIPAQQVEKWKSDNPGWRSLQPVEIGQRFKADYVIELVVTGYNIYEPRTREFLKGRTAIDLNAYNMSKGTESPDLKTEINQEYPRGRFVEASDTTTSKFQSDFVKKIASEIAWKFVSHETKDRYMAD